MKSWLASAALALVALSPVPAQAQIKLPLLYSDGTVLQRHQPMRVWGWDTPGRRVTVTFDRAHAQATAAADGRWQVTLPAHAAGGPYVLTIEDGHDKRQIDDVLVGDVWLCSGQSNMEFTVSEARHFDFEKLAANDPTIRQFKIPRSASTVPLDRLRGGRWVAASPDTVGRFSAVCWFFARHMQQLTGVPQGLINSTWGGSRIQAWTSAQTGGFDMHKVAADMAAFRAAQQASAQKTRARLRRWPKLKADVKTAGGAPAWAAEKLDVSSWTTIATPQYWGKSGYYRMVGVAWYRTSFTLTRAQAAQGVTLGLGEIDDSDRSYVNGHLIGHTDNRWDRPRVYRVPPADLHAGRNTIAIRVDNLAGDGGIHGPAGDLYVQRADGSRQPLAGRWHFRPAAVSIRPIDNRPLRPAVLYNAMIHPIEGYPLRGILWYQGASNAVAGEARAYAGRFKALITSWRKAWHRPHLPFLWVQISNFDVMVDHFADSRDTAAGSPWAELRAAQTSALSLPDTGQVVTIDQGNGKTIHPNNKQIVGYRLALVASRLVLGRHVVDAGPTFSDLQVDGDRAIVSFATQGDGLAIRKGRSRLRGFEIAGADGRFHVAQAHIMNDASIVVTSPHVPHPVAVRYAWSDNPLDANLVDRDGLPAVPFRAEVPQP